MSQTEIKLLKPLKCFASHSAFLFRANTRIRMQWTHTPIIIPPIFSYHSITINSSPSSYNPFFSLHLLSLFHYNIFTTSPLSSSPLCSIFPRNDMAFYPRHLSDSLYRPSPQLLLFSSLPSPFPLFLTSTCCHPKPSTLPFSNR